MTEKMIHSEFRLGKQFYIHDQRTLQLASFMKSGLPVPSRYDFDQRRRPFPNNVWGNDRWGDCVVAARANHFLRWERVEHRTTLPLEDEHVIETYKRLSGAQAPGDSKDKGLVMLEAMRDWFNGWPLSFDKDHSDNYKIAAYGSLFGSLEGIKAAVRYLSGCQLGIWLPRTAISQTKPDGMWDVVPGGDSSASGSWGGHAVYCYGFTPDYLKIWTWGFRMKVSNSFWYTYGDEAWAVVDDLDSHSTSRWLNVPALRRRLSEITS